MSAPSDNKETSPRSSRIPPSWRAVFRTAPYPRQRNNVTSLEELLNGKVPSDAGKQTNFPIVTPPYNGSLWAVDSKRKSCDDSSSTSVSDFDSSSDSEDDSVEGNYNKCILNSLRHSVKCPECGETVPEIYPHWVKCGGIKKESKKVIECDRGNDGDDEESDKDSS